MATPFQTPSNEKSFSSLIDEVILATGRPGSLINAVQAANLTIRECQSLGLFARDMEEDGIVVGVTPYTYARPPLFRILRTAKYVNAKEYPELAAPGKKQRDLDNYFYAVNNDYVFSGISVGDTLALAYYLWSKSLTYYARNGVNTAQFPGGPYDVRVAYYDEAAGIWYYWTGSAYATTTGSVITDALYQTLTTNWLVTDWRDLIISGTKAKIYNSANDTRGPVEYSAYKATQKLLMVTVGREGEGF